MSTRKSPKNKHNYTKKEPRRSSSTNTILALLNPGYSKIRNEKKEEEDNILRERELKRDIKDNIKKIQKNNDKRKQAIVHAEKNKSSIRSLFYDDNDEDNGTWRTVEGSGIKLKKKQKPNKSKKILYKKKSKTNYGCSITYKK